MVSDETRPVLNQKTMKENTKKIIIKYSFTAFMVGIIMGAFILLKVL